MFTEYCCFVVCVVPLYSIFFVLFFSISTEGESQSNIKIQESHEASPAMNSCDSSLAVHTCSRPWHRFPIFLPHTIILCFPFLTRLACSSLPTTGCRQSSYFSRFFHTSSLLFFFHGLHFLFLLVFLSALVGILSSPLFLESLNFSFSSQYVFFIPAPNAP